VSEKNDPLIVIPDAMSGEVHLSVESLSYIRVIEPSSGAVYQIGIVIEIIPVPSG